MVMTTAEDSTAVVVIVETATEVMVVCVPQRSVIVTVTLEVLEFAGALPVRE
jgi:hypothetical protein